MKVRVPMREALNDQDLFEPIMRGASWFGWRVLLIAAAGEELTEEERIEFKRLTGRDHEPNKMVSGLAAASGRRSGKSRALSVFICWISCLCDHRDVLVPGETGVALIISRDQRAAGVTLDYIDGVLHDSKVLAPMIANCTADSIELTNGIVVEVRPANRVSVRGVTCICVIAEEIGFWFTSVDLANPDVEILGAVRPTLLTTRGPLLMASSVYAKRGVLFDTFKRYYGPDGPPDILVAYGSSRDLNPSLSQELIDRELEKDPVRNRAEYLSEWRSDVEGFIGREIVEACVRDYRELPPQAGISYRGWLDPASGVPEGDSLAFVVSHRIGDRVTIDAIREARPPFNFFEVIETVLVPLCQTYRITKIVGDNYGGELAKLPVRRAGISYELSEKHTSQLYLDPFLGMLNAGKIDLPNHDRAINQICSLERSVQRSGRDQISHPTHGHDDIANAIAGAVDIAHGQSNYTLDPFSSDFIDRDLPPHHHHHQHPGRRQSKPTQTGGIVGSGKGSNNRNSAHPPTSACSTYTAQSIWLPGFRNDQQTPNTRRAKSERARCAGRHRHRQLRCNAGGDAAMNKPLSLSDHQLRQIHAAAKALLPLQRSDFVHGVKRRLAITQFNEAVQAAISAELALNHLPASLCSK
jgi:hypothetical protein